jgi:hypothetical protein
MKPIAQQRREFEEWWIASCFGDSGTVERDSQNGEYVYRFTQGAWLAWQEQERRHAVEFPEWGVKTVDTADQDEAD